jgi:L-arabinose transport system substrate-binding protein
MVRGFGVLAIAGCLLWGCDDTVPSFTVTKHVIGDPVAFRLATTLWTDETPGANGPKLVYILREPRDLSVPREMTQIRESVIEDGAHLYTFQAADDSQLIAALQWCKQLPAQGIMIVAPHKSDGLAVSKILNSASMRIMAVDGALTGSPLAVKVPHLETDYRSAGEDAVAQMVKQSLEPNWDLQETGAIVFVSECRTSIAAATDAEIEAFARSGIRKQFLFVCPLSSTDLSAARDSASKIMRRNAAQVKNWFIAGSNDLSVIGGLRAAEEAGIGVSRTIGVGLGGDGAIYDLQRPRKSGLFGSMLLPEDRLGQKSEHQLYNWVVNKVPPANYDSYHAVFMTRDTVRKLKAANHVAE